MPAPKAKKKEYEWSGEIRRLIPMKGNAVRVQNEKGKSATYYRDSEEFIEECRRLNEVMNGKIERELTDLEWNIEL